MRLSVGRRERPPPTSAVVGDNVERDLEPAATAGLRAIWLHRPDAGGSAAGWEGPTITSLYELVNVLESLPSTA